MCRTSCVLASASLLLAGCAHGKAVRPGPRPPLESLTPAERIEVLRRAQVWAPTDIKKQDLLNGPPGEGSFPFGATVTCDYYTAKELSGHSPKFDCELSKGDVVKVKYGVDNGETFGEVAGSRLFRALGFGADRNYSVRVVCNGCPPDPWKKPARVAGQNTFDPAALERKMEGKLVESKPGSGWEWPALDLIDESQGGAPRAQVDALKLLAVMVQHTDSKADQQKILCLPGGVEKHRSGAERCTKPFLMVHDLGLTFGSANLLNTDAKGSVNHREWSKTPIWEDDPGCVANISKSYTGTLHDPVIGEAGRRFLADLLVQLSDQQIQDLVRGAQFERRVNEDDRPKPTLDDWVRTFKKKRDEIVNRTCPR
jgi:hypothetical protein